MNMSHRLAILRPLLVLLFLGLIGAQVRAQGDPPGRVGRLNHMEGTVSFSPAGDNEWIEADANRPLTRGDRLWTDKGSRAELQVGSAAVRMDGQTQVEVLGLDDRSMQLSVTQGTVYARVRSLPEGENFEIDTPNLAYRAAYPGDYRIDVDGTRGTTRVTIHSGTGAVYGERGHALPLGGGQQITFRARSLAQVGAHESPPQDNFDRWAAERNRRDDQSVSARYVPREVVGYQQLDAHGQWTQDANFGPVWLPQGTSANWAPYREGRWDWISPWGWTWIDDAPWGFATSHYGRWAMVGSRWGWVPGRIGLRPTYAPALVAFIGGGRSGSAWTIPLTAGRPGVAWFPLAPGEAWQPGFQASEAYLSNVNRNMTAPAASGFAHQARPEALTALSNEDFHRGRPARGSWLRVAANALTQARIVAPPPMPEGTAVAVRAPAPSARATPPASLDIRQVAVNSNQARTPAEASTAKMGASTAPEPIQAPQQAQAAEQLKLQQAKLVEQARQAEQAKAVEAAKAIEAAKAAEAAKAIETAKAAEQAKALEQAKAAEQAKTAALARAAEQAKAAELARAEQARIAEQTRAAQQAKAEQAEAERLRAEQARLAQASAAQQARAAEQAAQARAAEQVKPTAQAKAAEQARIAQLAKQTKAAEQAKARELALAQQARAAEQARSARQAKLAEQAARQARSAQQAQQARQAQAEAAALKRERLAKRAEPAKREQVAKRGDSKGKRDTAPAYTAVWRDPALKPPGQRGQAAKADPARRDTSPTVQARRDGSRRETHAQQVEQARRAAEREAEVLRVQREQARRDGLEREQAQRETWERQQQALSEQWRRDHQVWEQQQRERTRQRPDLRNTPAPAPEVWQRGIPILNPGRTS